MQGYETETWREQGRPQGMGMEQEEDLQPLEDLVCYARQYAREKPEMAALICFALGFVVGWRLKPW